MGQPLPISRIMHTGVLLQCELDTTIADAAARMSETSVSSILITDGGTVVDSFEDHGVARLRSLPRRFSFSWQSLSQKAFCGSGCVSRKMPSTPIAAAALASGIMNSGAPPEDPPAAPGFCTECVLSKTTG